MRDHSVSSRGGFSRSERRFIKTYLPAAFAAGSLAGSIIMMSAGMLRIMPAFLGFSLHGLGFALAAALVAILFEQQSASYRTDVVTITAVLRDARRRCLLTAAALGAVAPNVVTVLAKL